jgi:RNA polymerase sigma-70 factor (ECF subfamily)
VPLDDVQIMQRVQNGQHELFGELVSRYRDPLLRVARRKLGDAGLAEDVVQEAFLAAFAARDTFNPQFAFSTWLWTILLNLCRRQLKRKKVRPRELSRSVFEIEAGRNLVGSLTHEGGLQNALVAERNRELQQLLDELTEVQADALRLRFFGGLKFHEIAETMGSSLSAAKVRVRNGLAKLAERLRADEGESS